jgi:hypothetical protein
MQEVDINQIFNNLALEELTLSTFIVGNEKFNNYYTDKNYHDEATSFNNIFGFNLNNNTDTNYINLITPSKPSSSPTTNYFLRIENVNELEKNERVKSIRTFNEIYNFVETLKLSLSVSVPVPEINIVEYAYSNDPKTVSRSLKKLFCTQNNTQTGVTYPLCDINLDTKYDKICLIDGIKQKIVTKFGKSFKLLFQTSTCSTSLFIAKTKYISDAVTFHDKIEEIKNISNPRELQNQAMQNQAMQNFLMAQTNLLYFYILLNNEKQIVSFDSHYNNIMILPDYKVALIDFKQYYKTSESEIIYDITKNPSFKDANTIFVQYLKKNQIDDILFDDEKQPGKRRKIDNETEQIKINPDIKNDIICLLFAEYYAHHKTCNLPFCTSLLDSHLINLLKDPFNTNDNFTDNILLLNNLYTTHNNSYVECNSRILTYIRDGMDGLETPRGARGGKNVRYRKKKQSKKRTKKQSKKRTKKAKKSH